MSKNWQLPRRTFLKGLGTMVALPMLEAMAPPISLLAADTAEVTRKIPNRMAFLYVPNGVNMADWRPEATGSAFELPYILEPLKAHQPDLQVITGLAHNKAFANGDGAGDHARASATFLTGCQARKTAGADIRVGVSVDQIAAEKVGKLTRLPSLELSSDRGRQAGNCDSGYSCAYSYNISWKSEAMPMAPEHNPRIVFDRMFSNGDPNESAESRAKRNRYNKSILDFVLDDAKSLKSNLGVTDRRKLDEYLDAIREMEVRIDRAGKFSAISTDFTRPSGVPDNYEEHLRLMFDLLALAFQTDTTRVSTFILAHDGDNRGYSFIGIPEGHHDLSHHQNMEEKKKKIAQINRFHITQFAYFLDKLKSIKEGEGTLLDHSMIVYGSGISDGNAHNHNDLPVLLAGHGSGSLSAGRHLKLDKEIPMTNLYLSMLDRMGVSAKRVGDSTGKLENI